MQSRRHRAIGVVAAIYVAAFGTVLWLSWMGVDRSPVVNALCFAPTVLVSGLARTSTVDLNQYMLRIVAGAALMPILLLFWGTSLDMADGVAQRAVWPFAVAASIGLAVAFVGLIFWGGSYATRVPAAQGALAIGVDDLRARLMSLNDIGAPLQVVMTGTGEIAVALRLPASHDRAHVVTLKFEENKSQVRVRERLAATGARPQSADEASMRSIGDDWFDSTRPDATSVSSVTAQTSTIGAPRLAAMPLHLSGSSAQVPADIAAALDTDAMCVPLCAVVTRSRWDWQPAFITATE